MAIFAGYGAYVIGKRIIEKDISILKIGLVTIILLSIVIIPPFVTVGEPYRDEPIRETHVVEEEMESATYLRYNLDNEQSFVTSPGFHSHVFTGISQSPSLALGGHQFYLINDSKIRDNIEYQRIFQDGFDLERYYQNKGLLYRIPYDPLFPDLSYWRPRHSRLFKREFGRGDRYHTIVDTYNIRMIVINRNLIEPLGRTHSLNMQEELSESEYVLYSNSYFDFYPVKY